MDVIDTHLHCWDRDLFRYDWLAETDLPHRFVAADIQGVPDGDRCRAVFVEADRSTDQALAEARWALSLGREGAAGSAGTAGASTVRVAAAVAHAPLGTGATAELDALRAESGVTGIRRLLQDEPLDVLRDPALIADLVAVGERGLVFDACVRAHQLHALADLAAAAPQTTIVLDHLGKPDTTDPGTALRGAWREGIEAVAARPSTVVKLSGILPASSSFDEVRPWIDACLEAFGPDRAVLGSDWPVSRRSDIRYVDWFEYVLGECGLGAAEVMDVGHRTAERLYRVGP